MNSKQAQAALEDRQAKLADLQKKKEAVSAELTAKQGEHHAAIMAMAKALNEGNATQGAKHRLAALALEKESDDLERQVKGLDGLVADAEAEVTAALAQFRELEAKENDEIRGKVAEKLRELAQELVKQAPGLMQEACEAYISLCEIMGALKLVADRLELLKRKGLAEPHKAKEVEDLLMSLPAFIGAQIKTNGHKTLLSAGYFGQVLALPMVAVDKDLAGAFPTEGIFPLEFAEALIDQETRELEEKYQKELNK